MPSRLARSVPSTPLTATTPASARTTASSAFGRREETAASVRGPRNSMVVVTPSGMRAMAA